MGSGRPSLSDLGFNFLKPARRHLHFEGDALTLLCDMTVSARWLLLGSMSQEDKRIVITDDLGQQHLCGICVRGGLSS